NQTERARTMSSAVPMLPKLCAANRRRLCLGRITDPDQFEINIAEKEPAARCALPRMHIGCALAQTKLHQTLGLHPAVRDAYENVVQFYRHWSERTLNITLPRVVNPNPAHTAKVTNIGEKYKPTRSTLLRSSCGLSQAMTHGP